MLPVPTDEEHMTQPTLYLQGMNIVFLGDFNPTIFQPAWFVAQGLIGENEGETANIQAITPDVVVFTMDWLRVQVTRERFQVSTEQEPYYEMMRDMLIGTFTILEHTPIHSMGINLDYHYRMPSVKAWHEFGHVLTPKNHWDGIIDEPGLLNLTMQGKRPDEYSGLVRVTVAPSVKVSPGVHIGINDHYEVVDPKKVLGCIEIIKIINEVWVLSSHNSKLISQKLLEVA